MPRSYNCRRQPFLNITKLILTIIIILSPTAGSGPSSRSRGPSSRRRQRGGVFDRDHDGVSLKTSFGAPLPYQ